MVTLVEAFGFRLSRVRGSHHIFVHPNVRELVTLFLRKSSTFLFDNANRGNF
ncbi:MAG TPA: type II toxin-antitoxin system HicA family toxin [Anaerolineae bacterium]|nr:type II toxin-antitoxin system HicA family toxin [Anaerolineae bacterium]